MKNYGRVQGDAKQAVPLVVGKDTVYVHANIAQVPDSELWEYDEIQYGKDEYIELMSEQAVSSGETVAALIYALVEEGVI